MKGIWLLSWRHLTANPIQSGMLVLCIAITVFVPIVSQYLMTTYSSSLTTRGRQTPLVVGSRGSRFDLTLTSLYFRRAPIEPLRRSVFDELTGEPDILAMPVFVGFTARDETIVGTSIDYLVWRDIVPATGRYPVRIGEAVLGHAVAQRLGLEVGGEIFSDQTEVYDISKPPSIRLAIVGILRPKGTPDDHVLFVDVKTTWVMAGMMHGHRDTSEVTDDSLVIGRSDEHVAISGAMLEHNQVTAETIQSFHVHGDPGALPLTSIIVAPNTPKAGTILKTRLNVAGAVQAVEPGSVVDELLGVVFKVKTAIDVLALLLAICTAALGALVMGLSLRLRATEINTLNRMGCGPRTVFWLCATEILMIVTAGLAIAAIGVGIVARFTPELIRHLSGLA